MTKISVFQKQFNITIFVYNIVAEPHIIRTCTPTLVDIEVALNESQAWLMAKEEVEGKEYQGRGTELAYVQNTVSAPQVDEDGVAGTHEMRRILTDVNRILRHRHLERICEDSSSEATILRERLSSYENYDEALVLLRKRFEALKTEVKKQRAERFKQWAKESWKGRKKAVYRYASGKSSATKTPASRGCRL